MAMDQEDIAKYKKLYLQTAKQYINQLQHHFGLLLQGKDTKDTIKEIHLAAHSLKSQSLVMGYKSIGEFCAGVEKIFKRKQEKNFELKSNLLAVLDTGITKLARSISEIEKTGKEVDFSSEIKKLETFIAEIG